MKTLNTIISAALLYIMLSSVTNGNTLWQKTDYGMSFDEVYKLYPSSRDCSFKIGRLQIKGPLEFDTKIANHNFQVSFYFSPPRNTLDRVILRYSDKLMNDHGAAVARHFVELLQSQYGEGNIGPNQSSIDSRDIERVWVTKDKIQITFSFFKDMPIDKGEYKMSITYDGKKLEGASDL